MRTPNDESEHERGDDRQPDLRRPLPGELVNGLDDEQLELLVLLRGSMVLGVRARHFTGGQGR